MAATRARRVGEALLGQPAGARRRSTIAAWTCVDRLLVQVVAEAERVGAGGEGQDRGFRHADASG